MEILGEQARQRQAKVFCAVCRQKTNHTLQYALSGMEFEGTDEIPTLVETWLIWKCDGCEALVLEDTYTFAGWFEGDFTTRPGFSSHYPNVNSRTIIPKDFKRIPPKIRRIYQQTISAFNEQLDILCATGLRSIIEGVCDDREISGKHDNLERKMGNLTKLGIPGNIIENLHSFRFMGNTAIHELTAPDSDDLHLAIGITEDILNYIYDLDYKLTVLRERQKQTPKFALGGGTPDSGQS